MALRKFDRFMVYTELGGDGKVGRLTDAEFRCLVTGVWPIAAKAPIRGRLLVGDFPAEPADVARQAHCSLAVASKTLEKLRALGMVEPDDEFDCERCHHFEEWNPGPKSDPTAAERMRRYREKLRRNGGRNGRNADRNADRNGYAPEVEGEERKDET